MAGRRRHFLGIDSGRSSTHGGIGDETGQVLGRAGSGPLIDLTSRASSTFASTARSLLHDVKYAAGLPRGIEFAGAAFGISGCSADKFEFLARLAGCESSVMVTDADIALEGAAAGGPGVVVIAGTGSMALARDARRNRARCGGWGYVFGDAGSAFDIVRGALGKALASEEGWGGDTILGQVFRAATGCSTVNAAMHRFYDQDWPRDRIAGLAVEVDSAARGGDQPAQAVLKEAGHALAGLATRALQALPGTGVRLTVFPSGGVFASRSVSASFEAQSRAEGLEVGNPLHDPAVGALLVAYRAAKIEVAIREVR